MLSRYADVSAALREPGLGAENAPGPLDPSAHAAFRQSAKTIFSSAHLDQWLAAVQPSANCLLQGIDKIHPIDLVGDFAEPWSLEVAVTVTGADPLQASRLSRLARDVFDAASDPFDEALPTVAGRSTTELAFALGNALNVQTFVALSQSLPSFLAAAWLALLLNPAEAQILRDEPGLLPNALEELLRFAGPSRAQFRRALCTVDLNGTTIETGQRTILMLTAANRDPEQFPEPDRLDVRRCAPNHLAFGGGAHACVGAALVRAFAALATDGFLHHLAGAQLSDEPILWRGGFALQSPASVRVRLSACA